MAGGAARAAGAGELARLAGGGDEPFDRDPHAPLRLELPHGARSELVTIATDPCIGKRSATRGTRNRLQVLVDSRRPRRRAVHGQGAGRKRQDCCHDGADRDCSHYPTYGPEAKKLTVPRRFRGSAPVDAYDASTIWGVQIRTQRHSLISKSAVLAATTAAVLTGLFAASTPRVPAAAAAVPGCPPGVTVQLYCSPPQLTSTMQWTFFYAPTYSKVLSLVLDNAAQTAVLIKCSGRGCPYHKHSTFVGPTKPCGKQNKSTCPTHGSLNLTRAFKNRHLSVGTKLSVAVTRSGWIGKYYLFTMRHGRPPRIALSCLAPGQTAPTAGGC